MKEYKRLTEKRNGENAIPLRNSVCGVDLPHWRIGHKNDNEMFLYGDAVNRLAELEDKIENGTLIELPCKVGDEVYQFDNGGKIYEATILDVTIHNGKPYYETCGVDFDNRAIGETVFLTKDRAEAKLRELEFKKRVDCGNAAIVED